jgi:hypothetical protein
MKWDRERVTTILDKMLDNARRKGIYQMEECTDELEKLVGDVRAEAVAHTWTEACSQYDRGMDPRNYTVPQLVERVKGDLNPERDK